MGLARKCGSHWGRGGSDGGVTLLYVVVTLLYCGGEQPITFTVRDSLELRSEPP